MLFAGRVDVLARIVNFGALSGFALLHLSVINHYFLRGRSGQWLAHLILPLFGLIIIVYVLYEMDLAAKALGACWIGIGVVYHLILTFRSRKSAALET
jgi:hypothetical protein